MDADAPLPDYAPTLSACHRAHAPELRRMIGELPLAEGARVLEVACGDGVYSGWLAERVGKTGRVVALDVSFAFLDLARRNARGKRVNLVAGALERLPFAAGSFDLVWCAQSLYSLPEPVAAVRAMAGAVRPGGVVAVLENDTLHHILLPWPVEVELAVRAAELIGFAEESARPRKFYVGRQLREVFRTAGLTNVRNRTWAVDRHAPLGTDERDYLTGYLDDLRGRAGPRLDGTVRERFERLVDPSSPDFLLDDPDLVVTCLDHVVTGERAG